MQPCDYHSPKKVTQTVNEFRSLIRTSEHILALGRGKGMIYPHREYSACCNFEENVNKRITTKKMNSKTKIKNWVMLNLSWLVKVAFT